MLLRVGTFAAFVILVLIAVALLLASERAQARDDGRYANSDLREWFQGLTNKKGGNCCAESDGVRVRDVDWDRDGKSGGGYRVRLCSEVHFNSERGLVTDCEWYDVPDDAVLDTPNRAGDAMVWRQWFDGKPHILCFLPGSFS